MLERWKWDGISIHAPRGGSDRDYRRFAKIYMISIHAPRGGSDSKDAQFWVHIFGEGI